MTRPFDTFVWYELMTTDVASAKAFYATVAGWTLQDVPQSTVPYTLFTTEGSPVGGLTGLGRDAAARGVEPSWIGYIGLRNVDAVASRVRDFGGTVHIPPTDIPGVSRFSVVTDPQNVRLGLITWSISGDPPPLDTSSAGRVGWYDLFATDLQTAFPFYEGLFDWSRADCVELEELGSYQTLRVNGQDSGGMFRKPPVVSHPFWLFYVNVDDIDAATERVAACGGRVLSGPMEGPGGSWIAHCADAQAAMFGLMGPRAEGGPGIMKASWSSEWGGRALKGRLRIKPADPSSG